MKINDTSKDSLKFLNDIYRKMPASVKLRRVFEAYNTGRILVMAGLRLSHPDVSEEAIRQLWTKHHLGEKLYNEVYGEKSDE